MGKWDDIVELNTKEVEDMRDFSTKNLILDTNWRGSGCYYSIYSTWGIYKREKLNEDATNQFVDTIRFKDVNVIVHACIYT